VDKKTISSAVALALFSATTLHLSAQAQELHDGASPPAAATVSKQTASGDGTLPAPIADLSEASKAQQALDELIRAYEGGNISFIQGKIDPTMIGYQRFLDGVRQDVNALRQIRVHLFNTQVVVGPDVAVVQTDWEKRFLFTANLEPGIFSGHSIFLLHRGNTGWQVAAFSGDNLFASQSGVLGQINVVPGVISFAAIAPCIIGFGCPVTTVPVQIEVIDPDLAGQSSLNVALATDQGDRETITLTATTPGRFVATTLRMSRGPISQGDGVIEVTAPTTLSVRYLDNNPGNNRPPSMLTRIIQIR
jgi:hypothetical protein